MAVTSGINQAFVFNGITYNSDDCIQSASMNRSINAATYQCGGNMRTAVGAKTAVFSASLAIDAANDSAKVAALQPGDNSTDFKWYPGSTTTGDIKMTLGTGSSAWLVAANYSAPVNGVVTVDITINLDSIADGVI